MGRSAWMPTTYASRAVVLDDRLGPLVEDLEPVPDRSRGVVRAPLLESAHVEPLDGDIVGNLEEENGRELTVDLLEGPVERLRLRDRPRKAVEDEALGGVETLEARRG